VSGGGVPVTVAGVNLKILERRIGGQPILGEWGQLALEPGRVGQGRTNTRGAAIRQQVEDGFEELFANRGWS
jgi:hypothetical protein